MGYIKRWKEFIDANTGEVHRAFMIIDTEKDKDFAKISKALTEEVLKELSFLDGAIKLLFWILDQAIKQKMFNRPIDLLIVPERVALSLGVSARTVERYIQLLRKKKILIQLRKRTHFYRLNPDFIWIGSAKSYKEFLQQSIPFPEEAEKEAEKKAEKQKRRRRRKLEL